MEILFNPAQPDPATAYGLIMLRINAIAFSILGALILTCQAELTLSTCSDLARDEVDVDRLAGALIGVVDETMQPDKASIWLRGRPDER